MASVDQTGGAEVTSTDVDEAISQLDMAVLQRVGMALIQGDTDRAADILAASTNLTDDEINAIVAGAEAEAEAQVAEIQAAAAEAAEAASTYATATLWALFSAGALALIACLIGGRMGTQTSNRLYVVR